MFGTRFDFVNESGRRSRRAVYNARLGTNPVQDLEVEARFDAILKEFGTRLRRTIASHCPTNIGLHVDDIMQEACLRLWRALSSGREIHDFPSYLHRVAATVTIDAVRRLKTRREEQMPAEIDRHGDADVPGLEQSLFLDTHPSAEALLDRTRLMAIVKDTLGRLPANRRRAVGLHLQGWTTDEIAALMGWTEAKARNLVYRGLDKLRSRLRDQGYEYESE